MKIAFCIENFITTRGGAEQYVKDLSRLLSQHGHEIHIFTLRSNIESRGNINIHIIKAPRRPKFLNTFSFAVRCREAVRRRNFDIVHSFGRTWGMDVFQPLGGSQMAGLVGNIRSIEAVPSKALKITSYFCSLRRISYFLIEWVQMRESRLVIAISAMVKNDLLHYSHLSPEKVRIVRNGVDLDKFNPQNRSLHREEVRKELRLDEDDIVIVFVAHNFRLKGLCPLIRVLAHLSRLRPDSNFKVLVLGEGKKAKFSRYAFRRGVGEKVIFLGSTVDAPRYYAAADVCVHPSFYDPSALVVMEAMATGLPVITTTYCGTSEIIEDGKEGYVVENPNNIAELAERLLRLENIDLRNSMGELGRRRVEQFSYARNMQEILEIHNEYISSGPRP